MSKIQEVLPDSEFLKKNLGISEIPTEAYRICTACYCWGRRRGFRSRT